MLKIYLDDDLKYRPTPKGWVRTFTAQETIDLLKKEHVFKISLDHDIGDERKVGNGYDVLKWIENMVATTDYEPPLIEIHTANTPARQKMEAAKKAIWRMVNRR